MIVYDDGDALADGAASLIARWLREAPPGAVSLGLAGGGTPKETYRHLVHQEAPWSRVHAWMGDERWVPPDHPQNNGRMARDALLDHVPATFHPLPWDEGITPADAAKTFDSELEGLMQDGDFGAELIILGLGEDGHTCSLFPGTTAFDEKDRLYVENWVPQQESWRTTVTFRLLHAARRLVFLISGSAKAPEVARILDDRPAARSPAWVAGRGKGETTLLLDRDAATGLV